MARVSPAAKEFWARNRGAGRGDSQELRRRKFRERESRKEGDEERRKATVGFCWAIVAERFSRGSQCTETNSSQSTLIKIKATVSSRRGHYDGDGR
ncbi:uncharacterized protein A4U43_C01F5150 [Asparagus officinalis]|uniref:Uncharacterized protein n=1 Tax=Asparagus officinalis TaxID=4686 RepID=A0A5P1FM56_ASPOF|nr:uncharacterized protein A4U43_C01F5150 [Asparagus officinalis]